MPRALVNLIAACIVFASAAYAATVVEVPTESVADLIVKYAWVFGIAMTGWAASSLPVLADWGGSTPRKRLVILQGIVQAIFFGFLAFWGSAGAGQNIMASYLAAAAAAYAGDRYFTFGRKREPGDPPSPDPNGAK